MNSAEDYTYRYLETDDLDQYNALLRYTFQVTEEELTATGWKDDEIKQSKFPVLERADVLGCFDGKNLVSQFAVYPLKMNIYDTVYHVGFVTSVCTYPEYTGNGIMKRLMIQGLTQMHKEGKSFALLHPAVPSPWVGDHLQQDLLQHQGPADPHKGLRARLCAARRMGQHRIPRAALALCFHHARVPVPQRAGMGRILALG